MSAPVWDHQWAAEKAALAVRYLAENFPEAGGSEELDPWHEAAHEAAVAGDRAAYERALRGYVQAGRQAALRRRAA